MQVRVTPPADVAGSGYKRWMSCEPSPQMIGEQEQLPSSRRSLSVVTSVLLL